MIREGHFNCPLPERREFKAETHRFLSGLKELQTVIGETEIEIEISK